MKIKPYEKNPKKHPKKQLELIAKSIKQFGWRQPIVVDKDGVIIVGHGRWQAWNEFKDKMDLPEAWVIDEKGNTLMGEPATEELGRKAKAYRLADNKVAESDWEEELLLEELRELEEQDFDISEIGFDDFLDKKEEKYTAKIELPVYEPSGEKPLLREMFDDEKYLALLDEIKKADIKDERLRYFLELAATRFIEFNFKKIADYYSYLEDGDEKELFKKLALVIIDLDDAIANGFAKAVDEILNLTEKYDEE